MQTCATASSPAADRGRSSYQYRRGQIWAARPSPRRCEPVHRAPRLDTKRVQAVMGHASITMTFDRYGHLFADAEGDREAMKKLEAAVLSA